MICTINAEIFTYEDEPVWPEDKLRRFFSEHGENAIVEFRQGNDVLHAALDAFTNMICVSDARLPVSDDLFLQAHLRSDKESTWIVCGKDGSYQTVIKKKYTYYDHAYNYSGEINTALLDRYDILFIYGLNDYAFELFRVALPKWTGHHIILCGEWILMKDCLPDLPGKNIVIQSGWQEGTLFQGPDNSNELHITYGLPHNESFDRFDRRHVALFDEVMTYTFCFSNLTINQSAPPSEKKYFLIGGLFTIEGIFGIWDKVSCMARFAMSKGYTPLFSITQSDYNIYSDHPGDDIWSKFMRQPGGVDLSVLKNARYVVHSPNANCLSIMRHIMEMDTDPGVNLDWDAGVYNDAVENYISRRKELLISPADTLGILIRGTDYTKTALPGHPRHASVKEIIDKVAEVEKEHVYKWLYLATEDINVLDEMRAYYGDKLIYTDQERFDVNPGETLQERHHKNKKDLDGFKLGVEYLCSLRLLSMCDALIASGQCGGVSEALRENKDRYRFVYIFDLGINPR